VGLTGVALVPHPEDAVPETEVAVPEIRVPVDPGHPVTERPDIELGVGLYAGGDIVAELDLACERRHRQGPDRDPDAILDCTLTVWREPGRDASYQTGVMAGPHKPPQM
jgi:hypothetical protein